MTKEYMGIFTYLFALIGGYLIGNVQFAVIFSKLMHNDDVRRHGSGNAGSTNMLRVYGVKAGALTFAGDFIKGFAGALLGKALGGQYIGYVVSFGIVLGHNFPVFFGFKGGKGVAASLGIILALTPLMGGITVLAAGIVVALSRTISLASLTGAAAYSILVLGWGDDIWMKIFGLAMASMLVIRHAANIRRLIKGEESVLWNNKKTSHSPKKTNNTKL